MIAHTMSLRSGLILVFLMRSTTVKANVALPKVRTEDLTEAIAKATGKQKYSLCFIEVFVLKDDTSKELLEWGSGVSADLQIFSSGPELEESEEERNVEQTSK